MSTTSPDADRSRISAAAGGRHFRRLCGWVLGIGGCVLAISQQQKIVPWLFMWLLVGIILSACKLLTWLNLDRPAALPTRRLLGYLFLWPGMRPQPFLAGPAAVTATRRELCFGGLHRLLTGLIVLGIAVFADLPWRLRAWLGMAGFSLAVHFGVFDVLAAAWRRRGVPVEKLFACPAAAKSLADFWGNRWNRAFSAFAQDLIFRPLARRLGTAGATLAVFLFSGLAHEAVISVPAGGGYGGPMLYFLIQGLLVLIEKTRTFRRNMRDRPVYAWLRTATGVLGPLPLLFHRPFLQNVVLPFLAALGG
jgi:alginate O-acetyltransferase complex protein AlgI